MSVARRPALARAHRLLPRARPGFRLRRREPQAGYLAWAEASLAAAAATRDLEARAPHQEECKLWLMLAAHRRAIEGVVARHLAEVDGAAAQDDQAGSTDR